MKNKKIGIVGYGYVGKAFDEFFKRGYETEIYDEPLKIGTKDKINECELAVVCVPTNMKEDKSADISIVEDVISWINTPLILIKSAIPPKTTNNLILKYKKQICVSPEYLGEGKYFVPYWKYPHPTKEEYHDFLIVGGNEPYRTQIIDILLKIFGPSVKVLKTSTIEAEIIKYMENSWGATKVTFANEFYEICKAFGADYQIVREGFLMDGRTERMHTMIREEARGFGGKCFPKDINGIVFASEKAGYSPELLKQVIKSNDYFITK